MTSRIDIIGQNGNDCLAYLEDVGDEQQHVSSSQAEIDHIPDLGKMVTGRASPPDGAQYWHSGNGLYPQGWYRLDADGWKFHDRHGSIWHEAEPPPSNEMQRIMPSVDHIGEATEKADHFPDTKKMIGVKLDEHKARFDLIPPLAELAVAHVLRFGAEKYAPGNWALVENGHERYMAAALRHLNAYRMGELEDIESGYSHLAHAICCLLFVLEKDECAEFTKLTGVE